MAIQGSGALRAIPSPPVATALTASSLSGKARPGLSPPSPRSGQVLTGWAEPGGRAGRALVWLALGRRVGTGCPGVCVCVCVTAQAAHAVVCASKSGAPAPRGPSSSSRPWGQTEPDPAGPGRPGHPLAAPGGSGTEAGGGPRLAEEEETPDKHPNGQGRAGSRRPFLGTRLHAPRLGRPTFWGAGGSVQSRTRHTSTFAGTGQCMLVGGPAGHTETTDLEPQVAGRMQTWPVGASDPSSSGSR